MIGLRLASFSLLISLASASACPAPDGPGPEPVPGDGDGDGDGDETGGEDIDTFGALCELACARLLECAPAEFALRYANPIECRASCVAMYGGCVVEGSNYLECFAGLACAEVTLAATDSPAVTPCATAFAAAQLACGLDTPE